ncbi:hypothetical protein LIER_10344 [Lithospermum erythrorhizon]|uniref:Uncharacterized protein n=1 Tax=Lithospermum erythrorhizon TaxID=34254 RepID=A0AAV3PIV5_LITER
MFYVATLTFHTRVADVVVANLFYFRLVLFHPITKECPYAPLSNLVIHPQTLATHFSTSSSDDSDTSSADSPLTQLAVADKGTSKFMPELNVVRKSAPIKVTPTPFVQLPFIRPHRINFSPLSDKMSPSLENQPENFELRPCGEANQVEASVSGGMPILHPDRPTNPTLQTAPVNPFVITVPEGVRDKAARAEKAYQGMASFPTFVKNFTPPGLTDDQLDGITSYFSIPLEKVDTRLALPHEQFYLPHIEEGSYDPDLTFGYTSIYVEAFSYGMQLSFSRFVNDLLITIN